MIKKAFKNILIALLVCFMNINFAFAIDNSIDAYINPLGGQVTTNVGVNLDESVPKVAAILVNKVVNEIFGVIGIVALVIFIIAGLYYVFAIGKEEYVKKAKDMMKYTVIGIVIIFAAYAITNFIVTIVNRI